MDIKSGDLNEDIKALVLEIVATLPYQLRTNEISSNIWIVLTKHIQTLNIEVIHTENEINHIKDLENYTEHKIAQSLVNELLQTPVLYEAIEIDANSFYIGPHTRRRFTLPVLKIKK